MKAKVILTSTAVLGLLTACSQDELGVVENNAPATATTAPIAGKAVIKLADNSTRFNKEAGLFENPHHDEDGNWVVDQIGLYQMDNYMWEWEYDYTNGLIYHADANTPEDYWKKQSMWWNLHYFTNNINTNYKYTYEDGQFVNPGAELVEGNYFLLFDPETSVNSQGHKPYANRRDLWKAIKKQVVLKDYTNTPNNKNGFGGLYGTLDNQFYLDYQQVYRDDETLNEDGELIIVSQLKPVLGKYTVDLVNESHTAYRFKEIRIYPSVEGFVPNIAYVRPAAAGFNFQLFEKYPETYPNGKDAFTVDMARSVVFYDDVTNGYIPYGYEGDDEVAAYYSIKFAEPAVIEAHDGTATLAQALEAIFVAPIWPDFENSNIVVYADKYDVLAEKADGSRGDWVAGYFINDSRMQGYGVDNKKWSVERTFDEANRGRLYFDDNFFHTYEDVDGVLNNQDLYDQVEAVLKNGYVDEIKVEIAGKGIKIGQELSDLIEKYEAKNNGKQTKLTFVPNGYDIDIVSEGILASNNYNFQGFIKRNSAKINILVDQELNEGQKLGNIKFAIPAGKKINISLNGGLIDRIDNEGELTVTSDGVLNAQNFGTITVPAGVKLETRALQNTAKGTIKIEGDGEIINTNPEVNKFSNNGAVVLDEKSQVTISDGNGTLDVSAIKPLKGGEQNHIEIVDPTNMTILYTTKEGDLSAIEADLKQILAAHIFSGDNSVKAYEITSSAETLSKNFSEALKDKTTITMKNSVTIENTAEDPYALASVVTFEKDLIIKGNETDLKDAVVKDIKIMSGATLGGTIEMFEGVITIYENGKLDAKINAGKGTIYGYKSQIKDEVYINLPSDVKVFGNF